MTLTILLSAFTFFSILGGEISSTVGPKFPTRIISIETYTSVLLDSTSFCEDISKINEMLKGDFLEFEGDYDEDIEGYMSSVKILSNEGYYIELSDYNSKSVVWKLDGVTYASILKQLKSCDLKEWRVTSNIKEFILSSGPDQAEYIISDAKEVASPGTGTTINLYNSWNNYTNTTEVMIQVYRAN